MKTEKCTICSKSIPLGEETEICIVTNNEAEYITLCKGCFKEYNADSKYL